MKVIDKQAHKIDILLRLRREIDLMESLDHPNIVKLHEVIETQFTIYVCMEYVEGKTTNNSKKKNAPLLLESLARDTIFLWSI